MSKIKTTADGKFEFKFYADAGHGWMAVKRDILETLGLLDKVSSYSYQRGNTVYLEEDCDASLVFQALGAGNIRLKEGKFVDRSPIRSYERFSL